jgi:protein-serine/threonine kinase
LPDNNLTIRRAHEILAGVGYDFTADWWSLGCILYEILAGFPPFTGNTPLEVFSHVMNYPQTLENPPDEDNKPIISAVAWDLITKLICPADRRLGRDGVEQIQNHEFFKGLNWNELREQVPPFVPHVS